MISACVFQLWTEMAEQMTSGVADYSTALGDVCFKNTFTLPGFS